MFAFLPNEKSPILAPILGTSMSLASVWGFLICFRLVVGYKVCGGLLSPTALRVAARFFLLLALAGLFNGFVVEHTFQALTQTAT